MEKQEQIRLVRQLMQRLDDDTNVDAGVVLRNPTSAYTCPELAEREWQSFFRSHPQVIGLSGDLREPGSFLTVNDFGVPVLAVRDEGGEFRAFLNVCRHRGVLLEEEHHGKRSRFVCPFHAWTYSNAGDLVGLPKAGHFGDIDKSCHGLIPLPAVERHGFLWVHPVPDGSIDTAALLGGLADEFDSWGFAGLQNIGYDTYDMRLNWKLTMDTFGETYHFTSLHRNTLALNFYGNVQAYDVFGRNHRMVLCKRDIDGLRGQPEANWEITEASLPVYYLFPNIQLNVFSFGLVMVRAYPDPVDPARSISRLSMYARPELLEREGSMISSVASAFAEVVRDEDYVVASRSQLGADSGVADYVIFGRNEPALHHYHNTYREALGMPPLEPL